jgi:hypothetical protein
MKPCHEAGQRGLYWGRRPPRSTICGEPLIYSRRGENRPVPAGYARM